MWQGLQHTCCCSLTYALFGSALLQASAAASLALLAARDGVVQDSVRYLGGIPMLVQLLNSTHPNVAEAARYDGILCMSDRCM